MRIYVGYESPSIVKYLKSSIGDLFIAIFDDYYFDESYFPTLGEEIKKLENEISCTSYNDPVRIDIPEGKIQLQMNLSHA